MSCDKERRMMIAAPKSGSGKTMLTCGLLRVLKNRGYRPIAFKCGPDFIDPMFHERVLGVPSGNLDTWFTDGKLTRALYEGAVQRTQADVAVIEGVMGYYDGAGMSETASSYELAKFLKTPVLLVVDSRGIGNSIVAQLKGYLEYRQPSGIAGILLNRCSPGMYPKYRACIEKELSLQVVGYVPTLPEIQFESRHLGLLLPAEIEDLRERIESLAKIMEDTVDIDLLLTLCEEELTETEEKTVCVQSQRNMEEAGRRETAAWGDQQGEPGNEGQRKNAAWGDRQGEPGDGSQRKHAECMDHTRPSVRIAVARDEAFCFYYHENLELLEALGAQLVYFSPIHDEHLPRGIGGLLLGGGYPELYKEQLSKNVKMLSGLKREIDGGLPYLAECGGFLYLQQQLDGYPMAGVFQGSAYATDRAVRFGYVELTANKDSILGPAGTKVRGHEFHYFDTTQNGDGFAAKKPFSDAGWDCMHVGATYAAGFPHLYFYSNPRVAERFVQCCRGTVPLT